MIFTYDDDMAGNKTIKKLTNSLKLPTNITLFKVPENPVVTYSNQHSGGSFEESFDDNDFIDACFNSILLISNPHITKKIL